MITFSSKTISFHRRWNYGGWLQVQHHDMIAIYPNLFCWTSARMLEKLVDTWVLQCMYFCKLLPTYYNKQTVWKLGPTKYCNDIDASKYRYSTLFCTVSLRECIRKFGIVCRMKWNLDTFSPVYFFFFFSFIFQGHFHNTQAAHVWSVFGKKYAQTFSKK